MECTGKLQQFGIVALLMVSLLLPGYASAAFISGSTGADGAFEPAANVAVQIPESGVLNYTTVNIPAEVTVTFKKNTQNTPVTILATGDVIITGTVDLNGKNGNYIIPGAGGPGGFDGGQGGVINQIAKRGEGPGGGAGGLPRTNANESAGCGGGGGYHDTGNDGATPNSTAPGGKGGGAYGNEQLIPILGGSGGGGGGGTLLWSGGAGGGGGGAIIIASTGTISVAGKITANGGTGSNGDGFNPGQCGNCYSGGGGGGGTGGSIRLIANTISGNGVLSADAGGGGLGWNQRGGSGSLGRVRLETSNNLRTAGSTPPMSLSYPYAVTPQNMPTLTITSIGGVQVPAVPSGSFGAPDVMLPFNTTNPVTIVVSGLNIPVGQTVTIKASPSVGAATSATGTLSGTETSSSVSISLNIATAYPSIITSSVTFQVAALNGAGPIYAAGEKVEFVRVAANLGGRSTVTYITESGKEVPVAL